MTTMMQRLSVVCALLFMSMPAAAYPASESFDPEGNSDAKAIALADATMEAMGGHDAWSRTRYVTWGFGNRVHTWDKHTGRYRLDDGKTVVLMNLNTGEGVAWRDGEKVTDEDESKKLLRSAMSKWINDAYWLVMPYKLKDSGVTLTHLGEGKTLDGKAAQRVKLTFQKVGRTPHNAYVVYVDDETKLVRQWDFYGKATDDKPRFQGMWTGWTWHGDIKLSPYRGKEPNTNERMKNIAVYTELPDSVFDSPTRPNLDEVGTRAVNRDEREEDEDAQKKPTTQPSTQPTTQPGD